MALVEISNFPGTPKLRCRVPNGTLFYDWLAANDGTFHRDLLIVRNGVRLGDDDELAFELSELDHIQIFDQRHPQSDLQSGGPGIFVPGAEARYSKQRR